MKKVIVGFLILLLTALSGCGNDVQNNSTEKKASGEQLLAENIKVPKHYTFQKESESGISKVIVDADVFVPEVDKVDVLEAIPVVFTNEEIQAFIDRHTDNSQWINAMTHMPYAGEGLSKKDFEGGLSVFQMYSLWISCEDNNLVKELVVHFGIDEKTGKIAYEPNLSYTKCKKGISPDLTLLSPLNENNMADDCIISLEQAVAFGDEEVKFFFPDFFLSQYGQLQTGSERPWTPGYYGLRYTRNINGIPVNVDGYYGVGDDSDYTIGNESVWITVNDDGVCWLDYRNPLKTGAVVEENVTLLPFEDIIDVFEKVSILSIQHLEIYEDLVKNVMDVREIRFGYMAVKQSESVGGYYYIPVWDFYGVYYPNYGQTDLEFDNTPVFTINAIDGTVIDRDLGY